MAPNEDATVSLSEAAASVSAETTIARSRVHDLGPGTLLGTYRVLDTIASGGGGSVYLADDEATGRSCAIKVLHPELARSAVGLARFVREISVVKMIRHPAIVDIFNAGELLDGRPYFVMELLEGSDLKELIRKRGRFSIDQVLEILAPVCSALSAAHAAGVVHRDVKASNVQVNFRDGRCIVKLLDFGVAKLLTPEVGKEGLTRAGSTIGTPATMAPEQIRGENVDERTDVYAIGVLMYHMLTGRLPYRAPSRQEVELLILDGTPALPSQSAPVSAAVDAVVLRCLEKAPANRFQSIAAVEQAFRAAVAGGPAPSDTKTSKRAVAISVAVPPADVDEGDDALLDDLTHVLDMAERAFEDAGLTNVLQTSTNLVVARVLSDDSAAAQSEVRAAREQALALMRRIVGRDHAHASLQVAVRLHVAAAVVSGDGPAREIDGPILDVGSWPEDTVVEPVPVAS